MTPPPITLLLPLLAMACAPLPGPDVTKQIPPTRITATQTAPDLTQSDRCWGHEPPGEITEIVDQLIEVQPAQIDADGREITPAIFRNTPTPKTGPDGAGRWFERVCDITLTPPFIMSLQRALAARGLFEGKFTGALDNPTRAAITTYQAQQGLNSDLPSVAMARQLGLLAIELQGVTDPPPLLPEVAAPALPSVSTDAADEDSAEQA